jgi:restriction endonuclease S subunit
MTFNGWAQKPLSQVAQNASRRFDFKKHSNVVFINTGDVLEGKFLHSEITLANNLPGQAKKGLRYGDILLSEIRPSNGRFAFIDFDAEKYVVSTKFMVIEAAQEFHPKFLYHVLTNRGALSEFQRIAESRSGTFPQITFDSIAHYPVPCPSWKDQLKIAEFLDEIQTRIELTRETNKTLESIAQAIFKSWFVDFDPVRAKMEGRRPEGMDEATAALFPDSFEESELGLVPKGWKTYPFLNTVHVSGGGTPKTSIPEYWDGDIPWFSVVDAPVATDIWVIDTEKHISEKGVNESSTKLLPVGTTIISARGTVGRLALTGKVMAMNQSCYGLRGKADDTYFTFFRTMRLVDTLKKHSHGSVFDTITRDTLQRVIVVYPDDPRCIAAFETTVDPLLKKVHTNLQLVNVLAALRDTLLPRLISGQLRLPEAQEQIENALT